MADPVPPLLDQFAEIVLMTSDAASYITGMTLTVGGRPQLEGMADIS